MKHAAARNVCCGDTRHAALQVAWRAVPQGGVALIITILSGYAGDGRLSSRIVDLTKCLRLPNAHVRWLDAIVIIGRDMGSKLLDYQE